MIQKLLEVADNLDEMGCERESDIITAVLNKIVGSEKDKGKSKSESNIETKEDKDVKDDAEKVVNELLNNDLGDLKDFKEEIIRLKNSDKYELIEDDWEKIYELVLDKKFKRDYSEKDADELEEELMDLEEDRKRKGELTREEELDYDMIKNIVKRKTHEDVRPSDID